MESLDNEIREEIKGVLTSSITGLTAESGDVRNVFEYEVKDGLFLGVTPREDEGTIATIYVYIADLYRFTDDETGLEDHPDVKTILYEIKTLLGETFDGDDINANALPSTLDHVEQHEMPGRYYAMDLPREAAPA